MDKLELNVDIRTFLVFLYHKLFYLLLFLLLGAGYSVFSFYKTSQIYTSNAIISIEESKLVPFDLAGGGSKEKSINNELFILKTYDFLKRVNDKTGNNVRYYKKHLYVTELLSFYTELGRKNPLSITEISGDYFSESRKVFFSLNEKGEIAFQGLSNTGDTVRFDDNSFLKFSLHENATPGDYFFTVDPVLKSIENLKKRIKINKSVKDSNIITIEYIDFSPARALDFLQTYIDVYFEEFNYRSSYDIEEKLKYLQTQKELLNEEFAKSLALISDFQESENLVSPKVLAQGGTQLLMTNEEKLFETRLDTIQLEKALSQAKSDVFSGLVNVATYSHNDIALLVQNLTAKKNELIALLSDYTEKHPSVAGKKEEIATLKKEIKSALERNIENNKIIIKGLEEHIFEKTAKLKSLPKNEMILNNLQKKMELNDKLLLAITEKEVSISVNKKKTGADFTVLEAPRVVEIPKKLTSPMLYVKPVSVSIVLFFIFVVVLYFFEKKVYAIYQLSNYVKIKKVFTFPSAIIDHIDEFKNIFYYILSGSKEKQVFYAISNQEKTSLKFAFFIAKFSMKKTLLVYLDSSKKNLQDMIYMDGINERMLENIELNYMSESILRKDSEEHASKNDFVDMVKLKTILLRTYDYVIFHTADEFHYIDADDIVIFNLYKKRTKKKFLGTFVDYCHKKKLNNLYVAYFLNTTDEEMFNQVSFSELEEDEILDVESVLNDKIGNSNNRISLEAIKTLRAKKEMMLQLQKDLACERQDLDAYALSVPSASIKINIEGLSSLMKKNEEELLETINFITALKKDIREKS